MNYRERIEQESTAAAKAKDRVRLSALRMMKAALHNREIDLKRDLTEAEYLQALSSMVKQRIQSLLPQSMSGESLGRSVLVLVSLSTASFWFAPVGCELLRLGDGEPSVQSHPLRSFSQPGQSAR